MEVTRDASGLPNRTHQFDLDEFDFLTTIENTMDVPKVVSDVLLHFRVDGFGVRRDLFPVL